VTDGHAADKISEPASIIACHECDLLQREILLLPGRVARCSRCGAELYRAAHNSVTHPLSFSLAAAVLFIIANVNPIVGLDMQGSRNATNLLGAVHAIWDQGMHIVAVLVFMTTFLLPAIELFAMIYLLLLLKLGKKPIGLSAIMRILQSVKPWGMVEVFMLGVLVALVKLTHFASVIPGPALWSFGALTLLLAASAASFDIRDVWERVSPARHNEGAE
jgi:paraquat-inducible protein A